MPVVIVREAGMRDCEAIFAWRNDAMTRQMSHDSKAVAWDDHKKWFEASLRSDSRLMLIRDSADHAEKVGIVRFDEEGERAVVSINVSPAMRGQKLAAPCLQSAVVCFREAFQGVSYIDAEVKVDNMASRRAFEQAGFTCAKTAAGLVFYELAI